MSLFQNLVVKKYASAEKDKISAAHDIFSKYFLNPDIQDNIRSCKEEQFQEGFLRELFVNVLGYTLNPEPNFNLITEKKNEKDAKKADGAILIGGDVVGVIELKDHKTTDLKQVEAQAFGYKNNNRKASYVVISNFEKLRFYIDNAIDFIEFNLFTLSAEDFALLWLCLAYENIAKELPKQIKAESISKEDQITKQLYRDYSEFKRDLFADLKANNPDFDQLTLFKKSQKLLDRLLFILFAEDCGLLPANSMKGTVDKWKVFNDDPMNDRQPLYSRFQRYFHLLNVGHKDSRVEVFAYNGGLFKPDEVLDVVTISDELLSTHTLRLSEYNFASEVDVNILGHIFENSLSEIEEITNVIEGKAQDAKTSKRKKDGVFYTPRYITTYIVENTLGKLCADKKVELEIDESEYYAKRQIDTKKRLDSQLQAYRKWLLSLTICDPACGSGAFLNAALDFLMAEHKLIDELTAKLLTKKGFMSAVAFPDIENAILENNLYGVDINEESVEIAKLALWLRTAKPHRKLNSLNDNIKCGNSLISDPEVAGDKAFDWHEEFPHVFANGGFDVVIGNPPYGAKIEKQDIAYLSDRYALWGISSSLSDTYFVFYAMSLDSLVKPNGILGFITPNTWKLIDSAKKFRDKLTKSEFQISAIVQHSNKVFADATVDCDTLIIKKGGQLSDIDVSFSDGKNVADRHNVHQNTLSEQDYFNLFLSDRDYLLKNKILMRASLVKDLVVIKNGVKPYEKGKGKPAQSNYIMDTKPFTSTEKTDNSFSPLIGGSQFHKYKLLWDNDYWIQYGEWLAAPREPAIFEAPEKLIFRQTSDSIIGTYIGAGYIMRNNTHILLQGNGSISLKYALACLNSKLSNYFYWTINPEKGEAMAEVKAFHLGLLPIVKISLEAQQPFIENVNLMLGLNTDLQSKRSKLLRRLQDNFEGIKITGALETFDEMDFAGFVKELAKQKIKLSLKQQDEWEEYFNAYRTECQALATQIATTDHEIDRMVYTLYSLTPDEIATIEKQ